MDPSASTTPPPPPPPPMSGVPVAQTVPTFRGVLRASRTALLGYLVSLGCALALMVLVVVAIAVQGDAGVSDDDPSSDIDIKAIGTLIGIPFQLVAMALGGSLSLSDDGFRVALFAPPLLVTTVFVTAVFRLSRRAEKASPSASTMERLLLACSGAFVTAVVAMVATRALAMRDDDEVMHAATVGLFLGVLVTAAVAGFLGRQHATASLWPHWLPPDARRAVHLATQHVVLWIVVVVPIAVVWFGVEDGFEAALYALVWGPSIALGAFSMGHLGAVTASGEHAFAWDLGWFPGIVLPLLAVLFAVVAALAWHLRRRHDAALLAHPASWVGLPAVYAVAGLVVCALPTVGISSDVFGDSFGVWFHGAYWLIPVLTVWGAAIEALSRFVAPPLAAAMPPSFVTRLSRGPRHPASAPAPAIQRVPMSPADRARAKKGLIGAGVLAGVGLAGGIVLSVLGSTTYSPENRAEDYLDALVDGDAEEALSLAPVDESEASTALLTNAVYAAAEERITGYEITDIETSGDTATVTVDLEGVDDGHDVELTLEADGRRAAFFRDWRVDDGGLASVMTVSVPDSTSSLTVNGASLPVDAGADVELWALPGSYAINPYGDSKWLEASDSRTTVPASETFGVYAEIEPPSASDELKSAVDAEIKQWIDGCMASTQTQPADCPQSVYPYGDDVRKVVWTLDTMPTVSWDSFDGTFPTELWSDAEGQATVTYEYDESYGFGAPDWTKETETTDLYVGVTVDIVDGAPVVTFDDD